MRETNVIDLFGERSNGSEVAANFAYLNDIATIENPTIDPGSTQVTSPQEDQAPPQSSQLVVFEYGVAMGDIMKDLRHAHVA